VAAALAALAAHMELADRLLSCLVPRLLCVCVYRTLYAVSLWPRFLLPVSDPRAPPAPLQRAAALEEFWARAAEAIGKLVRVGSCRRLAIECGATGVLAALLACPVVHGRVASQRMAVRVLTNLLESLPPDVAMVTLLGSPLAASYLEETVRELATSSVAALHILSAPLLQAIRRRQSARQAPHCPTRSRYRGNHQRSSRAAYARGGGPHRRANPRGGRSSVRSTSRYWSLSS